MKSQFVKYIISGILATGTDFLVYKILSIYGINLNIAKGVSFLCGTIISYFFNKYITFKVGEKSYSELGKFIGLYLLSMVINIVVNHMSIAILNAVIFNMSNLCIIIAFLLATATSVVVNFFGQKYWVFKE